MLGKSATIITQSALLNRSGFLLCFAQVRPFSHPMWNKKTREHFKPSYYDETNYQRKRRWNTTKKNHKYETQNPLFFDYDRLYLNRGIQPFMDKLKVSGRTDVPVNKRAYVLYHMAKQRKYDPELVAQLEQGLSLHRDVNSKGA